MNNYINKIPYKLDSKALAKSLKIDKNKHLYNKFIPIAEDAKKLKGPDGVFKKFELQNITDDFFEIEKIKFFSKNLKKIIPEKSLIFPYIITIGDDLEAWITSKSDDLEKYIADEIAIQILDASIYGLAKILKKQNNSKNLSSLNPGSFSSWDISEIKKIFEVLNPLNNQIDVTLGNNYIMSPLKTVCGILFETEKNFANCRYCSTKNCSRRKAKAII